MLQHQPEPLVPRGGVSPLPLPHWGTAPPPRLGPQIGAGGDGQADSQCCCHSASGGRTSAGLPVPPFDTSPAPVAPDCWGLGATPAPDGAWPGAANADTAGAARAQQARALAVTAHPQAEGTEQGTPGHFPNTCRCPG